MPETYIQVPAGLTTEGLLGRRYLARVIDSVVVVALAWAVLAAVIAALEHLMPRSGFTGLLALGGIALAWFGYGAVLESSPWQATLGKKLLGLKVYNARGGPLTFGQALLRSVVKDAPFLLINLSQPLRPLGILWLGAHLLVVHRSPVAQAIHDRVAQSWVAMPEQTTQLRIG